MRVVALRIAPLLVAALLSAPFSLAGCAPGANAVDTVDAPDLALWRIVEQGCRPGPDTPAAGGSAPDARLQCDAARGIAVLKDRCGSTHYLLIPIARRTGVESAELLRPEEPNYIALAWEERLHSVAAGAGGTKADIGLAVNSRYGRSQRQLHVHIDGLRQDVRDALRAHTAAPGGDGDFLSLMGHRYRVDHVDSLQPNLFGLLAREWAMQDEEERARLSFAVAADERGGFFVLSDEASLLRLDRGHAEELLVERSCGK